MVNLRLVQFPRVIQSFCKYFISSVSYRNMSEIIFHWRGSGRLPISICETKESQPVYFPPWWIIQNCLAHWCWKIKEQSETAGTQWAWMMTLSGRHTINTALTQPPPPPPYHHHQLHHRHLHHKHLVGLVWSGLFVLLTTTLMTRSKVLRQPKVRIKTDLILCPFH